MVFCDQSVSVVLAERPRLSVMSPYFTRPGRLCERGVPVAASTVFSSTTSNSMESPEHPVKRAISMPSISSANWDPRCSRSSSAAIFLSLLGRLLELADAEDHELRRLHRGDADLDHELALVDRVRRVRLGVALHEERLIGGGPEERAVTPQAAEEAVQRPLQD